MIPMSTPYRLRTFAWPGRAAGLITALLAVVALAGCPKNGEPPPLEVPTGPLRAGAAVRALEVPVGHSHAGYTQSRFLGSVHPTDDPGSPYADIFPATRGVETPASARALVLDNGHHQVVFARLDIIFITAELTSWVLHEARERLGLDLEGRLILNATHTHAAGCRISKESAEGYIVASRPPLERNALAHGGDTYSEESMRRIAGPLVDAIGEAFENLKPARLGWGTAENHTAARDRRCENDWLYGPDYIDPTVTVLRVDDAETGGPIAVAFHYAAHGTMYGSENRNLSVDALGHAEFKVEEAFETPVVALFLQGPAGDVRPSGGSRGHGGSQGMERFGWDLAQSVMAAYEGIEMREEVALQSMQRWVALAHDILGYETEEEFPFDGALLCNISYGGCDVTEPIDPMDVICAGEAMPDLGKYRTLIASARIDELHFLTMPGEAVVEIGRLLRERSAELGAAHTVVLGFGMDHDGYILTEEDWLSGGYEPTISFWGWKFGPYIVDQSIDLLREMLTGHAELHRPMEAPAYPPEAFDPVVPSRSAEAPAVDVDVPAEVPRLSEVVFAFFGGDPAFGNPEVVLERRTGAGDFEPVLASGWRPVSSRVAHGLPLRYEPSPTYKEEPEAEDRVHRYEVVWEPLHDFPEGIYRLAAHGRWRDGGTDRDYVVHSAEMTVTPATNLAVTAAAIEGGARLALVMTYPARGPQWSDLPRSGGWQIGGFRMLDPMFGPAFVPVWAGGTVLADVAIDGSDVTPEFDGSVALPDRATYAPGEGPGFFAALGGSGPWQVTVPEGALGDAHGNVNGGPVVLEVTAP
jgi:hypothetical protein